MTRLRGQGDDGVILIFALIFLGVIAVVVASVISFSTTGVRNVTVTRADIAKRYSADAALKYAVQQVRVKSEACGTAGALTPPTDLLTANTTFSTTGLGSPNLTVSCTLQATQYTYGAAGFGLITTNQSRDALNITGASASGSARCSPSVVDDCLEVQGPVFLASQPTGGSVDVPLEVDPGSAYGLGQDTNSDGIVDSCPPQPDRLTVVPPFSYECLAATPNPDIQLPDAPPTIARTAGSLLAIPGDCVIMLPGTYTGTLDLSAYENIYMASGVYYFLNADMVIDTENPGGTRQHLVGGWRGAEAAQTGDACANDNNVPNRAAEGVNGSGVKIVLGGSSRFRADRGSVELFTRVADSSTVDAENTQGVSLMTVVNPPSGAGWTATSHTSTAFVIGAAPSSADCGGSVGGGTQPSFIVHGLTYAPSSCVRLRSQSTETKLRGGLVAGRLDIGTSANIGGFEIAVAPIARPRRMTIVATASYPGERTVTATAEVLVKHTTGEIEISKWVSPL